MTGKVYIVGAGPGDPDLITIKGLKAIESADVILYDRLINEQLLTYAPAHAKHLYCGKAPSHHGMPQEEINHLLVTLAQKGYTVTRLKGGDPLVFGRGGEEAQVLNDHHIPFEIVPGITSGIAAPAYAGIPVTHRDYSSSVTFVTAVTQKGVNTADYWQHLAQGSDTLCIYMGVKKLPDICSLLLRNGKSADTPVALVHLGTTEQQLTEVGTLSTIVERAAHIKNPAMIIVGEVVRLREELSWFKEISAPTSVNHSKTSIHFI